MKIEQEMRKLFYIFTPSTAKTLFLLNFFEIIGFSRSWHEFLIMDLEDFESFEVFGIEKTRDNEKNLNLLFQAIESKFGV